MASAARALATVVGALALALGALLIGILVVAFGPSRARD
jgi:hypothetical protein